MQTIGCPLCPEGTPGRPYHREAGYEAMQCVGCGLVYVTPRPSEDEMKRLYEGQDTHIDLGAQIAKRHRKIAEAHAALEVLAPHAQGGRLLEIGVGAGYFLDEARRRGFEVTGLDINAHFVRFARDALGLAVIEGTLGTAKLPNGAFDVLFHRNVLSHLAYPVTEIARMAELLRPGGIMLFETGNVAELPGETWRGTDALALPDHLFHFSEATLRQLLDRTGFECVEVRRLAVLDALPPIWALRRALARPGASSGAPGRARAPFEPPFAPPARLPLATALARAHRRLTNAAGQLLGSHGRRCSLVVVARRLP